jgi:hypothetical protein
MVARQVLFNYKSKDIINKIIEYYIIEQERSKFEYVYKNISCIKLY